MIFGPDKEGTRKLKNYSQATCGLVWSQINVPGQVICSGGVGEKVLGTEARVSCMRLKYILSPFVLLFILKGGFSESLRVVSDSLCRPGLA